MYRSDLERRDRGVAIAAVVAIHAALAFAVLHRWGDAIIEAAPDALKTFDVRDIPPPPPPPPPAKQQTQKPKEKEGGSSPKNIKSQATPVQAPTPRIALPLPVPITTTKTPNVGASPTQGASDVVGPGTGAGGTGTGTGSGSGGNGPGGGGEGAAYPPQLLTPTLRGRDFPNEVLDSWPRGAQVFLRLKIDARGYVSECIVDRGSGVAAVDSEVCALVHNRFRYRPALNRMGQPVAGWSGYRQTPPR
jgi:protein TonB